MAHETVRGFILREVPLGDADRIVEIFTADRGLVTAVARGARRAKSPLIAATLIFTFGEYQLFALKGRYTIDSAELIESFTGLRENIERLVCAAHLSEVFMDLLRDSLAEPELYTLWAYTSNQLKSAQDPYLTVHIAQFKALAISGFAPVLEREDQLTGSAADCLNYCLHSSVEKLFAFRLNDLVREEVCQYTSHYLSTIMEKPYLKLKMIQDL